MSRLRTLVVSLALLALPVPAAADLDIFYVVVGNSHYRKVSTPEVPFFEPISGGNKSARKVAETLERMGAIDGILFRSESDRFVTREQVIAGLREVIEKAKKKPNPLVVYYFVGHGVSEGVGWSHFSVPGDFVGSPKGIAAETLGESMLYTGEIFDLLESSNVRFLLLLDNCYEGDPATLTSTLFSESLRQNLSDIFNVLRFFNEFHKPNPVLYSTSPGSVVPMVPDPLDADSSIGVGPLARGSCSSWTPCCGMGRLSLWESSSGG
jgi:hypothetical protein